MRSIFISLWIMLAALNNLAQTGGTFDLSHSVIASGGGSNSTGSSGGQTFRVDGTVGQNLAGAISAGTNGSGGHFVLRSGFWAFDATAPTAALVSVGGRVLSLNGAPVPRVRVILTGPDGVVRSSVSNNFGHYRIDGLEAGRVYVLTALSKEFQFAPRVVSINEGVTDLDLTALP